MKLKFLAFVVIILSNKLDVYGDSYKCQFESNGIEIHNQNLNGYSCKIELVSASSPNHINVNHIYGYDDDDVKFVSQPSFISEMDGLLQNLFTESCKKFTNLEGIQLRSSNVVKFNDESFEKCLNLKYLDFYNCNINEISEQSFSHQGGLKMLSLAKNRLSTLHESVFYNQRNLEFLTLWSNSISTLPPNIFSNLVNLQELGLGGNYIQNLNPLWFKNLRSMVKLSLISNQIQELPSNVFSSMKNLKELWMHNNKLQVIHSDSFGVLPKLTTVYFEQNSINGIDELFIDNTAISYISMWGNQCFQGALSRRNDLKSDLRSCFQNYQSKNSATTTTKMTTTTRKTTTRKIVTITRPTINIEETCGRSKLGRGNIIGGIQISRRAYPWLAALVNNRGKFFCGGTLITNRKVVTAAHCIQDKYQTTRLNPGDLKTLLGVYDLNERYEIGREVEVVRKIHVHQDWNTNSQSYDSDIAVLVLEEKVTFNNYIQPICLISSGSVAATLINGVVVGFGKSEDESKIHENIPKLLQIPIHTNEDCFLEKPDLVRLSSRRTFCGGYGNGTGLCIGDSGSGLIVLYNGAYYLRGVVSASLYDTRYQCDVNSYSIFTDVLKFSNWINEIDVDEDFYALMLGV